MELTEIGIRSALIQFLLEERRDLGRMNCIEELGICGGESRVDLAVLEGTIHGFEIKSEKDTLSRLTSQMAYYGRALGYVTAVTSGKHIDALISQVPKWWGVFEAQRTPDRIVITPVRQSTRNPAIDPYAVAQFLWREEALDVLNDFGLDSGVRGKPRSKLWERLSDSLAVDDLTKLVSSKLQERNDWRLQKLSFG